MIAFNKSPATPNMNKYIAEALSGKVSGDGVFTKKCSEWIEKSCGVPRALLTTSGSHALDMAARLCALEPRDEVIMPSYTFSSTANAFIACGARVVFVDIRPDTMNIDENLIEDAITDRTRVIVPVHYAGVACEMDKIMDIAMRHQLKIVEDAAHAVMADYKGKRLGTFGDFGCFSFHETKNYSMGEGGALLIREAKTIASAEILREKGTDRSRFFRGEIDKYSWVGWGSSYLPSDINAAYLWSQLEMAEEINEARLDIWWRYNEGLSHLAEKGLIGMPHVPGGCAHNAHMFYIKVADYDEQGKLISFLKENGIFSVFHYIPLHSSKAGCVYGRFCGEDVHTTHESQRLIRLPLWYGLTDADVRYVIETIEKYYRM